MKILFLDIDGVLVTLNDWETRGRAEVLSDNSYDFDPLCVERFNNLLKRVPDMKIVISSTWRILNTVLELEDMLALRGIHVELMGVTRAPGWDKENNRSEPRGYQCQDFIDALDVKPRVVFLDDDRDFLPEQKSRCVFTTWQDGLESKHVDKIVELFS